MQEKYKNKPWVLEDETGQAQYQGHLEGSQSATYYLLVMHSKEFVAIPAGSWYAKVLSYFWEIVDVFLCNLVCGYNEYDMIQV